jgi:hypothetical protein
MMTRHVPVMEMEVGEQYPTFQILDRGLETDLAALG